MNIETQYGVVHAGTVTVRGKKGFYRTVCSGPLLAAASATVTERPVNCAACRRKLEKVV